MLKRFLALLLCTAVPAAPAAESGAKLYSHYCAACHGEDGAGGVGVPLSLPSFLQGVSDEYLYATIRFGRPGRVMPAFRRLSDAQIRAIVRHIRAWAPGPAPVFSSEPIRGNAARGAELYKAHCASCHGPNGEGGRGTGVTLSRPRDLPILAPALNNPGFLAAAPDALIKATLIKGRAGTPMGSFIDQGLTEGGIDDIVAFIRAFERAPNAASAEVYADEPHLIVRESPYSVEETVENLKSVTLGANFRLIRIQYLDQGFVPSGKENKKRVIIYSCNFNFLYEALKVDPRVGLFLPCRITVVEHKGKVLVMAVNPKRLSAVFNNSELNKLCAKMHEIYKEMIEEAVL